jgi:hypothetical protein
MKTDFRKYVKVRGFYLKEVQGLLSKKTWPNGYIRSRPLDLHSTNQIRPEDELAGAQSKTAAPWPELHRIHGLSAVIH